eukprot:Rmarinus@m.25090
MTTHGPRRVQKMTRAPPVYGDTNLFIQGQRINETSSDFIGNGNSFGKEFRQDEDSISQDSNLTFPSPSRVPGLDHSQYGMPPVSPASSTGLTLLSPGSVRSVSTVASTQIDSSSHFAESPEKYSTTNGNRPRSPGVPLLVQRDPPDTATRGQLVDPKRGREQMPTNRDRDAGPRTRESKTVPTEPWREGGEPAAGLGDPVSSSRGVPTSTYRLSRVRALRDSFRRNPAETFPRATNEVPSERNRSAAIPRRAAAGSQTQEALDSDPHATADSAESLRDAGNHPHSKTPGGSTDFGMQTATELLPETNNSETPNSEDSLLERWRQKKRLMGVDEDGLGPHGTSQAVETRIDDILQRYRSMKAGGVEGVGRTGELVPSRYTADPDVTDIVARIRQKYNIDTIIPRARASPSLAVAPEHSNPTPTPTP